MESTCQSGKYFLKIGAMNTTTPQEAQAQLTEARLRTQGISGFSPVWVAYEIILIAMTF